MKGTDIILLLLTGVVALFMLAAGIVVTVLFSQRRILRQRLQLSELEADYRQRLLYTNIETAERERKRIAKDLHDEFGSLLSTLRLKVNQIEKSPVSQESQALIDAGMSSLRRIAHDLLPPGLEIFGLGDALEDLLTKTASGTNLETEFICPESLLRFDSRAELGVYRIVQELVQNTLKHSGANRIRLSLQMTNPTTLELVYSDNGCGFDPTAFLRGQGLGLQNIELRAKLLHGKTLWKKLDPGAGSAFILTVPIDRVYGDGLD